MTLVYYQLNDLDKTVKAPAFPYEVVGIFNDGFNSFLIGAECRGNILFESDKGILEADKELCELKGWKKLPNNVVCFLK